LRAVDKETVLAVGFIVLILAIYTQVTIFVVPPGPTVRGGRTLILWRRSVQVHDEMKNFYLEFVDSASGACKRNLGYLNLICYKLVLAKVGDSTILLRLPYIKFLRSIAETNMREEFT
jgi:hypothetical protein